MDRFLHFIVNKQSRNSDQVFKSLLLQLAKYTAHYKIYPTKNIDELDQLLKNMKKTIKDDDIIVVVGGDGSLNHFITLYQKYQFKNYISYIPAGSGNDFARAHEIPLDTNQAIENFFRIKEKQTLSFIHAQENNDEHYAVNSIGIGIDGLINDLVNTQGTKKRFGAIAYLSVLVTAFSKQKKFPVLLKTDDSEYEFKKAQLVLVANNPFFGGGINILPEANGKDDELDILIAEDVSFKNLLVIISKILRNKNHLDHPKLHVFKSKNLHLDVDSSQFGQKDGEVFRQSHYNYYFETKEIPFWI